MSVEKAVAYEKSLNTGPAEGKNYRFIELPRARKVGQSYVSSVWTTVLSFRTAFRLLTLEPLRDGGRESWDLLLVNGPGTCVVAAIAVMLPRVSIYTIPFLLQLVDTDLLHHEKSSLACIRLVWFTSNLGHGSNRSL